MKQEVRPVLAALCAAGCLCGFAAASGTPAKAPAASATVTVAVATNTVNDAKWCRGPSKQWFVNWDKALAAAQKSDKCLFVLNTGSDWCGWCKKLRADVLESKKFKTLAKKKLVLVFLDHPHYQEMPAEQTAQNNRVARDLGFRGGVPCVKILRPDGKTQVAEIGGYRPLDAYIEALNAALK